MVGPGSLTFLFKPTQLFGLLRLYPLRSSVLEAKYCNNDFVDEEDEARSSSGVLILALGCEISATLEPHLKQNLSLCRVHFRSTQVEHETQNSAIWKQQTANDGKLLAQATCDTIFFRISKIFFWIQGQFLDLETCLEFRK